MKFKKSLSVFLTVVLIALLISVLGGCGGSGKERILIYSSGEDYRLEYLRQRLGEEFPDYDITVEYKGTGDIAAKLLAEGKDTDCDIVYSLEYTYLQQLTDKGYLADISDMCDLSVFTDDVVKSNYYSPEYRNGGAVIINTEVLAERGLAMPESYADLLKPEYKSLISMPNPKSSGTGYMFLKSLVNAWGDEAAFEYFDKLTENILQYTSSGSGPVNALLQKEAAIGLGMTGQAVTKINTDNAKFEVKFFEEGSPYSLYGNAICSGKESREAVCEVYKFIANEYNYENAEKFFPEKIYKDRDFVIENYPTDIKYGDMSNDTAAEKERLLNKWTH